MRKPHSRPLLVLAVLLPLGLCAPQAAALVRADDLLPSSAQTLTVQTLPVAAPPDAQSQIGPQPPAAVLARDAARPAEAATAVASQVVLPAVPAYLWRHGCGPTALGMVVGYWDGRGYGELIAGSAGTQTAAVDQAVASGGQSGAPFPNARHYEDYAAPQDSYPNMVADAVISQGRTPHADDSLADFMKTSRSTANNYYGWSWFSDVGRAWQGYVTRQRAAYTPAYTNYYWGSGPTSFTWEVLTREIDAGRPMVLLVDTDGNGGTDHFITAIGYRDSPRQYGMWDTWSQQVRWENFAGIQSGVPWGIWGGVALWLQGAPWTASHTVRLPMIAR